jgi:hypothetical protein
MGNQICLRLVVPPAEELVCDADAHVVTYEHGGAAQHGGIQSRTVSGGRWTSTRSPPSSARRVGDRRDQRGERRADPQPRAAGGAAARGAAGACAR